MKYFVLPLFEVPTDEYRGIGSLLFDPKQPSRKAPVLFEPPPGKEAQIDYQVVLNADYFPRAWIVHQATAVPPLQGFEKSDRDRIIGQLMLNESLDLRHSALVETNRGDEIVALQSPAVGNPAETCEFIEQEADRVTLQVRAAAPGLLVLAETFYPGWEATLDNEPAEVLRTNRMMRGVLIPQGEHTVTFVYRPKLVYWSAAVSAVGWGVLVVAIFAVLTTRRVRRPLETTSRLTPRSQERA